MTSTGSGRRPAAQRDHVPFLASLGNRTVRWVDLRFQSCSSRLGWRESTWGDVGAAPNWRPMWDFVETWGGAELWEMLERVAR